MDERKPSLQLRFKIMTFIHNKKAENEFLDYKQQWESNKVELIKDIFSFINTVHHKDCYLIYGVTDTHKLICGVNNDPHRKDQEMITNLLASLPIAGGFIPQIHVNTITTHSLDKNHHYLKIDVLTIKDTNNVPIYLCGSKSYNYGKKRIRPGEIFSRTNDHDTGLSHTANYPRVESLWKKHFGLDLSIINKYNSYLSNVHKWAYNDPDFPKEHSYFSYQSDYKVRVNIIPSPYAVNHFAPFSLLFDNFNVSWAFLEFKYNNNRIILKSCNYVDGAYALIYLPKKFIKLGSTIFKYYSCIKNTFNCNLNKMLLNTYLHNNAYIYIIK